MFNGDEDINSASGHETRDISVRAILVTGASLAAARSSSPDCVRRVFGNLAEQSAFDDAGESNGGRQFASLPPARASGDADVEVKQASRTGKPDPHTLRMVDKNAGSCGSRSIRHG